MWPCAILVFTTARALFSTASALRLLAFAASIDASAALPLALADSRLPLAETLAGNRAKTVATVATLALYSFRKIYINGLFWDFPSLP